MADAVGERLARLAERAAGAGRHPLAAGRRPRRRITCAWPSSRRQGRARRPRSTRSTPPRGARRSPACWPAPRSPRARAAADSLMRGARSIEPQAARRADSRPTKPVDELTEAEAEGGARRARRPRSRITTALYHQHDAPKISDADYDALRRRNAGDRSALPRPRPRRQPVAAASAPPPARLRQGRATACRCSRSTTPSTTRTSRDFVARVRRFLGLAEDDPARRSSAEPKIDGLSVLAPLRERALRPGRHARRRHGGRGRHRQSPHHRRYPAAPDRATRRQLLEVRGEVYMTHERFRGA